MWLLWGCGCLFSALLGCLIVPLTVGLLLVYLLRVLRLWLVWVLLAAVVAGGLLFRLFWVCVGYCCLFYAAVWCPLCAFGLCLGLFNLV